MSNSDCNPMAQRGARWLQECAEDTRDVVLKLFFPSHDGSMVLLYMVTWIQLIYPLYVSIYTIHGSVMGFGACLSCTPMLVRSTSINSIAFVRKTATRISRTEQCLTEDLQETIMFDKHYCMVCTYHQPWI